MRAGDVFFFFCFFFPICFSPPLLSELLGSLCFLYCKLWSIISCKLWSILSCKLWSVIFDIFFTHIFVHKFFILFGFLLGCDCYFLCFPISSFRFVCIVYTSLLILLPLFYYVIILFVCKSYLSCNMVISKLKLEGKMCGAK